MSYFPPALPDDLVLPVGFRCGGGTAGIKASGRPDLMLLVADQPCTAAGVFTRNLMRGAPVVLSESRVPTDACGGVIINSGNANAGTGADGATTAARMTDAAEAATGAAAGSFLVASTGIIGHQLPLDGISRVLPEVTASLGREASHIEAAARAMMTTDTVPKIAHAAGLVGLCKGAAMIAPNMGTMLAVVVTDAILSPADAQTMLRRAVAATFNRISIDGHTSTSDTVFLLASGQTERPSLEADLTAVCETLAKAIVLDGEGAGHFVTVDVTGLPVEDAERVGRQVSNDALLKCALTGNDPNWGRIVSAGGNSGVAFDPATLRLKLNGVCIYDGQPLAFDAAALSESMATPGEHGKPAIDIELTFPGDGPTQRFYTTDLTSEYVRLNSEYTT